ncbi:MAG TPA: GDP-mannose 4,6-dehydratase [Nitrolancea sp.]|nr:GDP-mannose 4,6-dehydratase [Nitrolancea sp.]
MDDRPDAGDERRPRALITGASGFAGRHLAGHLHAFTNWDLTGLQTHAAAPLVGVRMLTCDLLDADLTCRVIAHHQPEIIFHLAGQAYVPKAVANPAATLTTNVIGQVNLLEACRAARIDPIIVVVSSADIYGDVPPEDLPIRETQPFRPRNPYAVSKATQDLLGLQYALSYGMRIVRVRPFNHIGPGQNERFVVSSLARQIAEIEAKRADPVLLVGNLEAQRDFLDVRDVVRAYALVARADFAGQVFNVASGTARPIQAVLDHLLSLAKVEVSVHEDPSRLRPSDIPILVGDASKLRQATGWRPEIAFEQSLADTLSDWRRRIASS